jgi:raffinose/stachyose/melibiose transport system permease protein
VKTIAWRQLRHRWGLYLLVLPALGLVATFAYFPAASAVYHSFFRWNGDDISEWVGLSNFTRAFSDRTLGWGFLIVLVFIFANLFKMVPSIVTAVLIHRLTSDRARYVYRVLFVVPMIIPEMVWLLIWKYFYDPTVGVLNALLTGTGLMHVLRWADAAFGWNVFVEGADPAWLGQEALILPSLIFWGFPWVGVVSVLLYLSGLGNIEQSIYDAAEMDGCGWFRKFWNVELPLIMTQVRLNLILMVIGTLNMWGLVFILLGDTGGPGGVAMFPALYLFHKAFRQMDAGYACAIGLLLFFVILVLTLINNRYVRVSK